jgi:hypothetical protein
MDSSGFAIVAVLSQPDEQGNLCPVSYFSRKLTDRERLWMIFDLELLAIVEACNEWRAWLIGTKEPVKVFSDHSNLVYFITAKLLLQKQDRWALFLDNFNLQIYHIAGNKNPADAPSRRKDFTSSRAEIPESQTIASKLVCDDVQIPGEEVAPAVYHGFHDPSIQRPSKDLLDFFCQSYSLEELTNKEFKDINGIVWYQGRVLVPSTLRTRIMKMYHDYEDVPRCADGGASGCCKVLINYYTNVFLAWGT